MNVLHLPGHCVLPQQCRRKVWKVLKMDITFHFSKNMFSFSKWVSEWAFIFKVWFFSKMYFHFQNVKGFVNFVFLFSEEHKCKQKSVHLLQIALLMRLWTNYHIHLKLLNLFQLSRIYNLLYWRKILGIKIAACYLFSWIVAAWVGWLFQSIAIVNGQFEKYLVSAKTYCKK